MHSVLWNNAAERFLTPELVDEVVPFSAGLPDGPYRRVVGYRKVHVARTLMPG